ncbi:MAG: SDR family oxidoreductase [Methylocystis sp.]|nr:SDR family oxidoreductase [Methylocystis sp.]
MKMAITGALGHIGSRLIREIRPEDFDEVVLLDNFATQRYCSLFDLPAGVPYRVIDADVLTANLEACFSGFDVVVHLAAITNAEGSFEIQDQVERVNFVGTERVARACAATGAKLIFLSSTSVYGLQQEVVDEDCPVDLLKPQSPYAESKIMAEQLLAELGASMGLRFVTFRFGTIYGVSPGMRFHTAVNKFAWHACVGQPLTVWRTALHQRRPYLDLADGVRALQFVIARDIFDGNIYNVVTDNLTVNDVIEGLRRLMPDVKVAFVDSKIMNQLSYTVSNERLRRLGFEYEGSLTQGIQETVALLRNVRQQIPRPDMPS